MEPNPVVTLLGKSCIRPATPSKRGHLFLSCLDIFWQHIHYNRRVIFYKPSPQDVSSAIESLKTSLSFVLVHFYPWAGRLTLGEDQRLFIDCNDIGVEFVEALIDLPISELEKDGFQMKEFFENLCQRLENRGEHLYTSPLLSVQATRFSDGGLAVAVAMSHVVADGQSLWHFLVSWGECARGVALSLEPLHERERLAVQDPLPEKAFVAFEGQSTGDNQRGIGIIEDEETKEATPEKRTLTAEAEKRPAEVFKEKRTEQDPDGADGSGTVQNGSVTPTEKPSEGNVLAENGQQEEGTAQCLFHVSGSSIKKLKGEVTASTGKSFSSFVILCAHFWQRMTVARQRSFSEVVAVGILINYRSRLTPPLPPAYFGNVIAFTSADSNSGTIAQESLGAIASRIQAAIAVSTEERLRGFMNWLELRDSKFLNHVKVRGKLMNVSSSPWFPAYEVDFGWAKPAAVRAVKVVGDGEIVLFGGRPGANPGDMEICMGLSSGALRNLLRDEHFVGTVRPPAS